MAPFLRLAAIKCLSAHRFFQGVDGTIAVEVAPSGSRTAEMREYDGATLVTAIVVRLTRFSG